MDEDDDTRTPSRSPTPSPPPNAAPSEPTLTLALPSRHPRRAAAAAAAATGGREEFWSEGATWTLIDAWGERFLELSRGSLKQKEWQEVADAVNRAAGAGFPKSDAQCKNRIDTLKKKYKVEKTKIASSWPFFRRLDDLLAKPSGNGAGADQFYLLPHCNRKKRTGKKKSHRQLLQALKPVAPQWPESSDSFPPAKKRRSGKKPVAKAKPVVEKANKGVKQLTTAIVRLGEIYERVERSKLQQTAELEKQRMAFAKELELQRMQFFIKTQLEITQLKQCHGNNNNNHNHSDADNDS